MIKKEIATKKDLVEAFKDETGLTKKASSEMIDTFMKVLRKLIVEKDEVRLIGNFRMKKIFVEERKGINPQNGEEITIPAYTKVQVKVGKLFKEVVN